ncbi:mitochondrial protein cyt-4 [Rhypophila decipiens]
MLRSSNQTGYVCWRCLSSRPSSLAKSAAAPRPSLRQPRFSATTWPLTSKLSQIRGLASHPNDGHAGIQFPFHGKNSRIRNQLRLWESEHPMILPAFDPTPENPIAPVNTLVERRGTHQHIVPKQPDIAPLFDGGELVDFGDGVPGLQPGDLVELSSDTARIPLLAICLGHVDGFDHFYTDNGKWFAARDIYTRFVVKKFILDPGELRAVIDAIPSTVGEERLLGELASLNIGPTRTLGESLRTRMLDFQETARHHNQVYSESLNRAGTLAGPVEKLMTLEEIAHALLPAAVAKKYPTGAGDGSSAFAPSLLYAVHRSISIYHDLVFRPLHQSDRLYHNHLYAVASEQDTKVIHDVEDTFRRAYEGLGGGQLQEQGAAHDIASRFQVFVQRAQQAIDKSRRSREWYSGGMLGPARKSLSASAFRWSRDDMKYITFLRLWAASGQIPRQSRLHWVGAAILRATQRYTQAEYLDCATGWTFLQEIGWTHPWDLPVRHSLRLPGVAVHGSEAETTAAKEQKLGPDLLASIRSDLKGTTVYCIDSEKAQDIDDGVSLEHTEKEGEYWINVHVADPASRIAHDSPLGNEAAAKSQTTYLAGYIEPMFTAEVVRDNFSLASGRPSLTFSARVNELGEILEYKITPHVLQDVVYMTPEDAAVAAGGDAASGSPFSIPSTSFEVGQPPASPTSPERKMTKPEELSELQVTDIKTLNRLAKALQDVRIRNGCIPIFTPQPRAEVSLEHTTTEVLPNGFVHCTGDPYIRIAYEEPNGSPLVSSLMQLAGNVAAKWCADRAIPIPYRAQQLADRNAERLQNFTQKVLYPKLLAGEYPTVDEMRNFRNLSGAFSLSVRPTSVASMGLDMYTKSTSPLRRYADLLVHWQIEAALLEESLRASPETADKSTKSKKHSLLPFSREALKENILPHLLLRERFSKRLANAHGNKTWILQALARAWRFGEGKEKLPETFRFTVQKIEYGNRLWGRMDWFEVECQVPVRGLEGVVNTTTEVKVGDEFIVKLTDVNVYSGYVVAQALRRAEPRT